jgi:predicted transcriptional regulator
MTQTATVLAAFQTGAELTAKQIASRYSVGNPHEVVRQLREQGHAIYLNSHKDSRGRVTQKYRLGTPSRAMVATAYAVLGTAAFN